MDYEKKYKKLKGLVNDLYPHMSDYCKEKIHEHFPELQESEDEKIRKSLIRHLDILRGWTPGDISPIKVKEYYDAWIAWLEKQGEQNPVGKLSKDQEYTLNRIVEYLEDNSCPEDWKDLLLGIHDAPYIKQKPVISRDALKEGITRVGITQYQIDNWLKKYVDVEEQCEQNPADEAEPKFKVGDWIIRSAEGFKHNTYIITAVKDIFAYYVCEDLKGERATFTFNDVHQNFKLWDISDAKDGDVLTCYSDVNGKPINQTGIMKQYVGRHGGCSNCFETLFGIDWDGNIITEGFMGSSDIYPATKEQRDLLFQNMTKAGYEWDANRKELKKIGHPWSIQDAKDGDILYDEEADGIIIFKGVNNNDITDYLSYFPKTGLVFNNTNYWGVATGRYGSLTRCKLRMATEHEIKILVDKLSGDDIMWRFKEIIDFTKSETPAN